ncbi:MAG: hypothetical protein IKS49_04410 [Actinomycetaceae bacterium]|nr:hypothetical protein [Actinomycetaceae bacterium]
MASKGFCSYKNYACYVSDFPQKGVLTGSRLSGFFGASAPVETATLFGVSTLGAWRGLDAPRCTRRAKNLPASYRAPARLSAQGCAGLWALRASRGQASPARVFCHDCTGYMYYKKERRRVRTAKHVCPGL